MLTCLSMNYTTSDKITTYRYKNEIIIIIIIIIIMINSDTQFPY
jgi:hypothetical protein